MPPAVPTTEEVNAYLAAHKLESTIEEAVNDAVLKQVKSPYLHIANILLKKSEEAGEDQGDGRVRKKVSLDPPVEEEKKPTFAAGTSDVVAASKQTSGDLTRTYTTSDAEIPAELETKLKSFFDKMDANGDGEVSKEEAVAFWGKNFAKVNAQSMFNEVDADQSSTISWTEFRAFWQNVIGSGYSQEDLAEEVDMMLEGGSWVDFNDGRTT